MLTADAAARSDSASERMRVQEDALREHELPYCPAQTGEDVAQRDEKRACGCQKRPSAVETNPQTCSSEMGNAWTRSSRMAQ